MINLGFDIPPLAKENIQQFAKKKLKAINDLTIPQEVTDHLKDVYMISDNNCKRYIKEYKAYLLVALCTKGTGISPSECTDIVWHSHQQVSHIYPTQMAQLMPKHRRGRFDHGPTKGGSEESATYDDLYKETRDVREYLFGPAPTDIWETLEHRWDPT